ncbi:hypothetical protein ACGFNU_44670 [Spirillospora sp. NPDC048911]|uniref:hypothetical protein n=1 Tax=Spirillospora sp. NPDC048911 TaxID=3364527 RepID=UPI0037207D31
MSGEPRSGDVNAPTSAQSPPAAPNPPDAPRPPDAPNPPSLPDGPDAPSTPDAPDAPRPSAAPERAELDRLRAEVTSLRERLDTREQRRSRWLAVRSVLAAVLVALAGFGVVCSAIGVWGARTTLKTDHWVATVETLPQEPAVAAAVSEYLTTEVFNALNVQQRLAQSLPPKAAFLSAPVTTAVRDYMRTMIQKFMQTSQFQAQWEAANRFAHAQIMAILENRSGTVSVAGSTVTLNLLPIVNDLLLTLEQQLPTMFGKKLDLPALTSGQVPPGLEQRIETALGVNLPADFAQIKLYNRDRLGQLQEAVVTFKRSVGLLVAGTILALGLAIWISPNRRRTILQFGLWLTIAVLVLTNVLRAVRDQLLGLVPAGVYREGASVAIYETLTDLRAWGDWILWTGIVVAVVAYLVGPGRLPVLLRGQTVRGARSAAATTRTVATSTVLRAWITRHMDALRVGGIVVAAAVALLVSSWTGLIVIAVLLAGYELLVTLTAHRSHPAEAAR